MDNFFWFLIRPFAWLARGIRKVFRTAFGQLSYRPPYWLQRGFSLVVIYRRGHPVLAAVIVLGAFLIASGSVWTWRWYQRQPKPHTVHATVAPIPVTPLDKELKFPPLTVDFSESAARLEDLKNPTLSHVRLDPPVAGAWKWISDSKLAFTPAQDWPADKQFRVIFDREFFPSHVRMDKLEYDASTPSFRADLKDVTLSEDAKEPGVQRVLATIEFTHSVDPGQIEKALTLNMQGGANVFPPNEAAPHFTVTFGDHNRRAFIRSSPVTLPAEEDWMKLVLTDGLRTNQGGAQLHDAVEQKTQIPSKATAFQIKAIDSSIVRNKEGEPEQILNIETSSDISTPELAKALHIYLLPKRDVKKTDESEEESTSDESSEKSATESSSDESTSEETAKTTEEESGSDEDENTTVDNSAGTKWANADEVSDEILEQATVVKFTAIPTEKEFARDHHFKFRLEGDGQLYVRVDKGLKARSGYDLAENHAELVIPAELPQEIDIQGDGGLLALGGERKLSVRSRGVAVIKFEIDRVLSTQINHLVSQTEGEFQAPEFKNGSFDQDNISRIAREDQTIALQNKWKANYSAFDLGKYLQKPADGGSERGLFFITARAWDPVAKKFIKNVKTTRFILVSDLGLLVKKNADQTSDVFVVSIKTGLPLANVTVDILGRNGIAVQSAKTSPDGRVTFTSVEKNEHERKAVVYVARLGDDISFIPYSRDDRMVNFSRFDIDGVNKVLAEDLDAFVFTERGVYRPGDKMHIAFVIKQRNWLGKLAGLPIETEVVDARALKVQTKKLALPPSGFAEVSYKTAYESPTGEYSINVYLVKNDKRSTLLGSTTVNVKEFLPDRMKIETRLSKTAAKGWVDPREMKASIALANLYGTPASDRRVKSRVELWPASFSFEEFKDYSFFDPMLDEKKVRGSETVDLGEQNTDADGKTDLDLQLDRFADATYSMRFFAEAFEGEGGRSITGQASQLVSSLPYVVGYKSDGDLNYINASTPRAVDLLAVDSKLDKIALDDLTLTVIAQEYVSVVTKKDNGSYAYESVLKERVAKTEKLAIGTEGLRYQLPTGEPGDYVVELRDKDNRKVSRVRFSVVGRGIVKRSLDKNSELQVKLSKSQYNTGEEIEISITAPYAGSGLITIERDKVYAQLWFKTNAASSVQRIKVPDGFEGSGYINVALIRALDSKEIFTSPLSYGVVPFTANIERRRLKVELDTPAIAKPGEPLHIKYKTDRPSKIAVFAVDQGILQVSDYKLPDPLGFFFRKCALGVETSQIVDLIMPEFSILRSLSAFGGDGDNPKQLNPFKRVTEKPVVFWSGIIDADPTQREVVYDVPDYFAGTLTVMAVAVADDTTGAAEKNPLIRGPFVITPSVPTLAAPGDEFEVGVTVANNVEGSGENADVQIRAEASEHLQIVKTPSQTMRIAEGHEQTTTFSVKVNDKLGSGTVTFIASSGGKEMRLRSTISVRPPTTFMTQVRSSSFTKNSVDVPVSREMYPEFRKLSAAVSAVPLGLAHGLDAYLKDFPHGCSEQITSAAFCRLTLADESDFGLSKAEVATQLENVFAVLRRRQNDQGAFGYWAPEKGQDISFMSPYAMHFLIEAKAAGFAPPAEMFASGLRNLQVMVAKEPSDLDDACRIAYAIYLLSREGVVTTNYIINLRDYLDKNHAKEWKTDLTGVYLAGALHILKKEDDATKLIGAYKIGQVDKKRINDFYQPLGADSQYVAVLSREFPDRLKKLPATEFEKVLKPIGEGNFNTLSAAYAVLALKSYARIVAQHPPELSIIELDKAKKEKVLVTGTKLLQRANFSGDAAALSFRTPKALNPPGAYYQVIEAGFDRKLSDKPITDGLEVYRELLDKSNQPVTTTKLGEVVTVRLRIRSLRAEWISNVALIDLLPGGFEVVSSSLTPGVSEIKGVDYVDVREDRTIFYATVPTDTIEITYQIKSCNRGTFVVPPVFAESMYDRNLKGRGLGAKIVVTK
ncbi:MAG TPA: alpha-2-macroglobulin [Chthoniobacterales bacterium]|nr:alpha-2-macroglobulin [Chthoniobacterales bacterium]